MLLNDKVKDYGYARLAYEMGITEMSIRNKCNKKCGIWATEWFKMVELLKLTDDEIDTIKKELTD